jgi:hypothetical protein
MRIAHFSTRFGKMSTLNEHLVQRFIDLIQPRRADRLEAWMNDRAASKQRSLQTFAET